MKYTLVTWVNFCNDDRNFEGGMKIWRLWDYAHKTESEIQSAKDNKEGNRCVLMNTNPCTLWDIGKKGNTTHSIYNVYGWNMCAKHLHIHGVHPIQSIDISHEQTLVLGSTYIWRYDVHLGCMYMLLSGGGRVYDYGILYFTTLKEERGMFV